MAKSSPLAGMTTESEVAGTLPPNIRDCLHPRNYTKSLPALVPIKHERYDDLKVLLLLTFGKEDTNKMLGDFFHVDVYHKLVAKRRPR